MRIRTTLFAGLLLLASGTPVFSAATFPSIKVMSERANVMSAPRTTANVHGSLPAGTVLEVLGRDGDWYWVLLERDEHGTRHDGWVRASDVTIVGPEPSLGAPYDPPKPPKAPKAKKSAKEKPEATADAGPSRSMLKAQARLERAQRDYEDAKRKSAAAATQADGQADAPAATDPEVDRRAVAELNERYLKSVLKGDRDGFEEILASDFTCANPDGSVVNRAEFLNQVQASLPLTDLNVQDVEVRVMGTTAIVHAKTTFAYEDGRTGVGHYTDVWSKRDGRWQAVSAHITRDDSR